jgi:hypothetical protein
MVSIYPPHTLPTPSKSHTILSSPPLSTLYLEHSPSKGLRPPRVLNTYQSKHLHPTYPYHSTCIPALEYSIHPGAPTLTLLSYISIPEYSIPTRVNTPILHIPTVWESQPSPTAPRRAFFTPYPYPKPLEIKGLSAFLGRKSAA